MSVRSSMALLLSRLRDVVGDPAGASQVFTDQQLQDALDRHRTDVRYAEMEEVPTYTSSTTAYKDFYACLGGLRTGDWESDATLYNSSYTLLAPDTSEPLRGHWAFNAGQTLPLLLVGQTYDVQAAAAEVFEQWIAKIKLEFDFSTDGDTFARSQKLTQLSEALKLAKSRARVVMATADRTDWN